MKQVAVYIATTGGPVRIERITPEEAPQSMICRKRSSEVLAISTGYDDFVNPGSGVIKREFGGPDSRSYRLDVDGPIAAGTSWQLAVYFAHAITAAPGQRLADSEATADEIVWLSGAVDYDLKVGPVDHMSEKLAAAGAAFARWRALAVPVRICLPAGNMDEVKLAADPANRFTVVPVKTTADVLPEAAPTPGPASARARGNRSLRLATLLAVIVASLVTWLLWPMPTPEKGSAVKQPPPAIAAAPVIALYALRAGPGQSCVHIHFAGAAPVSTRLPLPPAGQALESRLDGLCGLKFVVSRQATETPAKVRFDVLAGGYLAQQSKAFEKPLNAHAEWSIDLPRHMEVALDYRLRVIIGGTTKAELRHTVKP